MFILLFTIGRTGSCLLVNILNNYNNISFAGEIYNIQYMQKLSSDKKVTIKDFRVFDRKSILRGGRQDQPNFMPRNTNYHKYLRKPGKFMVEYNKMETIPDKLKYIMPQNEISGCKMLGNSKALRWFLSFKNIEKHFKIILLIRENTDELRDSMKRAGFSSWKTVNLNKENREYKRVYEENKENGRMFLLSYEDIINQNKKFRELFKFINIEYSDNLVIKGLNTVCSYASSIIEVG